MHESCPLPGVEFTFIDVNGIRMRIADSGNDGPLLLLAHGWPESWYNWRHQILYFAARGYRVVAPDMRGYGATDAPWDVEAYDINTLAADMTGILDALNADQAILAGHDWGAIVAWHAALFYPERFSALITMSVPYSGRPSRSPMAIWREKFGDNFFYILYHNAPGGVAEAEYDSNPRGLIERLYLSPDAPREQPLIRDRHYRAGGWIERLGAPRVRADWLTQADLDYVVGQFERAGFRGGLNYYRNFQRNWELTAQLPDEKIVVPALFIAGARDMVLAGADRQRLLKGMGRVVEDLRDVVLFPGIGHWVQQEAPGPTNAAMHEFLDSL